MPSYFVVYSPGSPQRPASRPLDVFNGANKSAIIRQKRAVGPFLHQDLPALFTHVRKKYCGKEDKAGVIMEVCKASLIKFGIIANDIVCGALSLIQGYSSDDIGNEARNGGVARKARNHNVLSV